MNLQEGFYDSCSAKHPWLPAQEIQNQQFNLETVEEELYCTNFLSLINAACCILLIGCIVYLRMAFIGKFASVCGGFSGAAFNWVNNLVFYLFFNDFVTWLHLQLCLSLLDAVVRYSCLPSNALFEFIATACRAVNIEKFCQHSWKVIDTCILGHLTAVTPLTHSTISRH